MLKSKALFSIIAMVGAQAALADVTSISPSDIRELSPQPSLAYEQEFNDILVAPVPYEPDVVKYTSGAHYHKQALTSTKPRITSSEKFVTVPGAKTYISVPAGRNVLVNVAFTAESRCNEPGSIAPDWCEVRVLVNGSEASPKASSFPNDTYAFDSTDRGTESTASWESHAMDRHLCVKNEKGKTTKVVPVEVQWKVTNFDGGNAPNFWLDDWSFTTQLARGCRSQNISVRPFSAGSLSVKPLSVNKLNLK